MGGSLFNPIDNPITNLAEGNVDIPGPQGLPRARGGTGRSPGSPTAQLGGGGPFASLANLVSGLFTNTLGGQSQLNRFQSVRDDISRAATEDLALRQADIREQLGGLGMRFSTDLINAEQRNARDVVLQTNAQTAPLFFGAEEGVQNRQGGALQTALGLPGQFQGLAQGAEAARLGPFNAALGLATGFPPVGQESRSKNVSGGGGVFG